MSLLPGRAAAAPRPAWPRAERSRGALASRVRAAWSAPRSPQIVVVVLSAWLTATANLALWRALFRLEPGAGGPLVAVAAVAFVFALTLLLLSFTAWGRWAKPVWLAVLLAAGISQHFMLRYGVVIDATLLASVFETNSHEAADLINAGLVGSILLVAALPSLWLARLRVEPAAPIPAALRVARLAAAALALALVCTAAGYSRLAPLVRNHMELRYLPNPVTPIVSAVKLALKPLGRRPGALVAISAGASLGSSHAAGTKPPLLVLVIGETARADHFALNGYARDTTPELAAAGVLSFADVWSCGTYTLASVPCMFSSLGKAAFAGRDAEHENLLDVARAAGLAVLWVDNQAGCKGVCDRVASASTADLAGTPEARALCTDGECLDEALLVGLDARIAALPVERRRNGVLVVMHQMGSHGPAYARRSPPVAKRFLPECANTTLGSCDRAELVNAYDNTIAYTDHVLARTIGWLRAQSGSYAPSLLYVSDHGESLGEHGVFLHGLPYAIAPDAQKHVPMLAWLGDDVVRRDRLEPACLRSRLGAHLSHDNLYHTALGLLDVRTPTYVAALDVWSSCRNRDSG